MLSGYTDRIEKEQNIWFPQQQESQKRKHCHDGLEVPLYPKLVHTLVGIKGRI